MRLVIHYLFILVWIISSSSPAWLMRIMDLEDNPGWEEQKNTHPSDRHLYGDFYNEDDGSDYSQIQQHNSDNYRIESRNSGTNHKYDTRFTGDYGKRNNDNDQIRSSIKSRNSRRNSIDSYYNVDDDINIDSNGFRDDDDEIKDKTYWNTEKSTLETQQSSADFDITDDSFRDTGDLEVKDSMLDDIDFPPMNSGLYSTKAVNTQEKPHRKSHLHSKLRSHHRRRKEHHHPQNVEEKKKESGRNLLEILIDIQKAADENENITHTEEEEAKVEVLYEDDIMLTTTQAEFLLHDVQEEHRKRRKRKLAQPLVKRWKLPIPYTFDGNHSPKEKFRIYQALAYWEELTCIQFKENSKAEHKLMFVRGRGCWSYVGYIRTPNQTVSIGDGCQSNGTIAHEVGHAIGFWHEQSRPDRDDYIFINNKNVTEGKIYNFDKRTWGEIITLDIPYDLGSDMHYGSKFYSKDENSTLSTVGTNDPFMSRVIGQRQGLSFYDVKLANKAYCQAKCLTILNEPCRRDGYQDPLNCTRCRCPDGFAGRYCEKIAPSQNAHCGGQLDARYNGTIFSPGYPMSYNSDVRCSWLIKAPKESHVVLQFIGKFGISGHTDVCKDYAEVRYNTSLALTGARFCCYDVPREPIQSDTNEMLVLFHTYQQTRTCDDIKYPWKCQMVFTGFKAVYWYTSCGGCSDERNEQQSACKRRVSYACKQTWEENTPATCPNWWYKEGCGEKTVTRSRYALCFRDQYYCCDGFQLNGQVCKSIYPRSSNDIPVTSKSPGNSIGEPDSVIPVIPPTIPKVQVIWTDWGDFGKCSRPCGGAYMIRTRKCIAPGFCGTTDIQTDQRPCNQVPCYRRCAVKKRVLCDLWTTCTRTVYEYCHPYCVKGFGLHGAQCVPSAA